MLLEHRRRWTDAVWSSSPTLYTSFFSHRSVLLPKKTGILFRAPSEPLNVSQIAYYARHVRVYVYLYSTHDITGVVSFVGFATLSPRALVPEDTARLRCRFYGLRHTGRRSRRLFRDQFYDVYFFSKYFFYRYYSRRRHAEETRPQPRSPQVV